MTVAFVKMKGACTEINSFYDNNDIKGESAACYVSP